MVNLSRSFTEEMKLVKLHIIGGILVFLYRSFMQFFDPFQLFSPETIITKIGLFNLLT